MNADFDRAAVAAMQLLIDYRITETPVDPMPMLISYPGVRVISFAKMANEAAIDRDELVPLFVANQDAATFRLKSDIGDVSYVVAYNLRLPFEIVCRAVARELGHIVLGHDGTRPFEIRRAEAMCFAHHLLSPRPVLHMLRSSGVPLTMNVLSDTTGCIDECVDDMRQVPGVHVPVDMNRKVHALFYRRISEYIRFRSSSKRPDKSPLIDLGTYMDFYEE